MRHTQLIVFGIILVGVVAFGALFWGDLLFNQQELANTPLPPSPQLDENSAGTNQSSTDPNADLSSRDDVGSIENDLNSSNVEGVDSGSSELEAEINAL